MADPSFGASNEAYERNDEENPPTSPKTADPRAATELDVVPARPQYANKAEFLLTCIGFAVGLGNLWRFPKIMQDNGGGAFFIPYFIMFFIEGVPLLYLELAIGQYMRQGSAGAWFKVSRFLGGIGICSLFVSFFVGCYYNTILAWSLFYMANSFKTVLPWTSCPLVDNTTTPVDSCVNAAEYYWYNETLNISPSITESGGLQWHLVIALIVAWTIVVLCMIKGVESLGKVVYFTALFPYVILFAFLVRNLMLEGAWYGVTYLFTPDLSKLLEPKVWLNAATQIFFSLSLGFGGMIAFSSFNPVDSDVELNTWIVAVVNSLTSLLGTFVVFAIQGFSAHDKNNKCIQRFLETLNTTLLNNTLLNNTLLNNTVVNSDSTLFKEFIQNNDHDQIVAITNCSINDILDKPEGGSGLAFIVFAEAIMKMPLPQLWSVLFFMVLLLLGLDSMFGNLEGVTTPLKDLGLVKNLKDIHVLLGTVFVMFLVSLVFVQGSGVYWLDVFDTYAGTIPLLIIALFELVAIGWVYNYDKFDTDLRAVLPPRDNFVRKTLAVYWRVTIKYLSPLFLVVVFMYYMYDFLSKPSQYEAVVAGQAILTDYPIGCLVVSFILCALSTLWTPAVAAWSWYKIRQDPLRKHAQTAMEMKVPVPDIGDRQL